MNVLIICIELLIGNYFIEINNDYIITYSNLDDETEYRLESIIDKSKKLAYYSVEKQDSFRVYKVDNMDALIIKDFRLLDSNQNSSYLDLDCAKYTIIGKNEHNWGFPEAKFEIYCRSVEILDKYLPDQSLRNILPFLGRFYKAFGKYPIGFYEISSGEDNKILIHKVKSVEEQESFSPICQSYIENFKKLN